MSSAATALDPTPQRGSDALPENVDLKERSELALSRIARYFKPGFAYEGTSRKDCTRIHGHALALIARLELSRRGLPDGISAQAAASAARRMAEAVPRMQGRGAERGPCWGNLSGPFVNGTAVALAYALHRYGAEWPVETKSAIGNAVRDSNWVKPSYVHNIDLPVPVAALLAGEALGDAKLLERGRTQFRELFERTLRHGGIELNAPLYTGHHFPSLVFLQEMRDEEIRARARILLEYELLVSAHLYLPGGGLGAPQSRDYPGGVADPDRSGLREPLWLWVGDPAVEIDLEKASNFAIVAASDYEMPEVIRSIFLDKGDGYEFWAYTDKHQGSSRTPNSVYRVGLDDAEAIPWQAVVLPDGDALLGVSYGFRMTNLQVTSGLYTRLPNGEFAILYQYQPLSGKDSDDTGEKKLGSAGKGDAPDDGIGELYDFERLVHHRTAATLWDPMPRPGVIRTHRETITLLPDYAALGGESIQRDGWYVSRVGEVYVAYRPLGEPRIEQRRDERGAWRVLRIPGPSGGIMELATTSEYPDLESYGQELASRHVRFTRKPLSVEFDARGADGAKVRLRLQYRPERRWVGGVQVPVEKALDHGLMKSPWVRWDNEKRTLTVERAGYETIVYDWAQPSVTVARTTAEP